MNMKISFGEREHLKLQQLIHRLKNDHLLLKEELDHIQVQASDMVAVLDTEESKRLLHVISQEVGELLQH